MAPGDALRRIEGTVIVARTWAESEAAVIKSLLEGYGIPCHYSSGMPHRFYLSSAEGLAQIEIRVPALLGQEALRTLREHRRRNSGLRIVEEPGRKPA